MNRMLLMIGGVVNVLAVLFHLSFWSLFNWPADLSSLAPINRGIMQTFNVQIIGGFVLFAYVSIFHWPELISTRLGKVVTISTTLFYLIRVANQLLFFEMGLVSIIICVLCLGIGAIYLVPFLTMAAWEKSK
jgi:hypothetical protein